ncbi:MAG: hypothetical protein AB1758_33755, partial [Candidatus Eremiobacterota bacterium]
ADRVDLNSSAPDSEPEAQKIPTTVKVIAGVGVALAVAGVAAAACGVGGAGNAVPTPTPVAVTEVFNPISKDAQALMQDVARPNPTDNSTALTTRNSYGSQVDRVLSEAQSFEELRGRLDAIGDQLDSYAQQKPEGGTIIDNGRVIGVEVTDGQVKVTAESPDGAVQGSLRTDDTRTVTDRTSTGQTSTLEETQVFIRVSDGRVTRTVYRESGQFEVNSRTRRAETRLTVDGASIQEEVTEIVGGIAGPVRLTHTTRHEVPEFSIMIYPRVELRVTRTHVTEDLESGSRSSRSETVEVFDNGSSKTTKQTGAGTEVLQEAPNNAPTQLPGEIVGP